MVVVDDLDEWLDLGSLGLAGFGHAAGDLRGVALNTGDQGVRVWVRLGSRVLWLNQHNLQRFLSALSRHILPSRIFNFPHQISSSSSQRALDRSEMVNCTNLLASISAAGDDGNTANFEDYMARSQYLSILQKDGVGWERIFRAVKGSRGNCQIQLASIPERRSRDRGATHTSSRLSLVSVVCRDVAIRSSLKFQKAECGALAKVNLTLEWIVADTMWLSGRLAATPREQSSSQCRQTSSMID